MDNEKLSEIFNKNYEKHTLKKFIIEQLLKAVNEDKWITINGKHILLKDGDTPHKAIKRIELKSAIYDVVNGDKEETLIKNVRDDLEQYGGSNDIAIIKGKSKGGALHIINEHEKDIDGVVDAIVSAPVNRYVKGRKVFLENDNYKVILSLDYFGKKKTWLLTGYKKEH